MPRLFTGPIELSESATSGHPSPYAGTQLRLVFRVSKDNSDPGQNVFPEIEIEVSRAGAWHLWQQHEVWLNGHLIGTINLQDGAPAVLIFPFQPKIMKVDDTPNNWEVAQENINELVVKLGSGGYGLNDSFDLKRIEVNNIDL